MPNPLDHGTINGPRTRGDARSPSTTTASTGPPGARAHAAAPAFPPLPPLVDTRTSVLRSVRPVNSRASSASAAVPDRSAVAGEYSESRWASTTMRRFETPARTPITSCMRR